MLTRHSIVFVHGFNGHPERTWTHKEGDAKHANRGDDMDLLGPPSKIRKLNPFSKSLQNDGSAWAPVYWPRDLIPETVPNARVLTYGYDTHIRHWCGPPLSKNTVYDISWDFLVALEAERRLDPLRPILFVAHSLGGIVVKEMVRRSNSCLLQWVDISLRFGAFYTQTRGLHSAISGVSHFRI
jgi:hypothetical protein